MNNYHTPVLAKEALEGLQIKKDSWYIDATLGGGGHTELILNAGGKVLGIDQDQEAINYARENLESRIKNLELKIVQGNFRDIAQIAQSNNLKDIRGILFDLGVSSHQLESKHRGFGFLTDSALDMRMDQSLAVTAKDLVNALTRRELAMLFTKYGEEQHAWGIAGKIIKARTKKPINTTQELVDIIGGVKKGKIHPATKVFQALRIAVNDELVSLEEALPSALNLLEPKGRLVVISFHSLEDRIVKQAFLSFEKERKGKIITTKPMVATEEEQEMNPRSRSAKLRIFEKA